MFASLSSWIISIAGIICLSVLIELILPEGQMNKYIKGIFSFIIVFVIISPLPSLLKKNIDLSYVFNCGETLQVDEDYLYQLNLDKLNALKNNIEDEVTSYGYKNVSVYINGDIFLSKFEIKSITVDLSTLVITANAEHNDISKIKKHITKIIKSFIQLDEEVILYNE